MSELALFSNGGQLPAHLLNLELDATTKALMGGGAGAGGKRISIKGGVFRMISGGKEIAQNDDRAMNIIIVKAAPEISRSFYAGAYVEGQNAGPTCWSNDGKIPDKSIKSPQGSNCANCQQSIKGSGQGDSRACRANQRLAVALENNLSGEVYQLVLPGQSVFGTTDAASNKMPLKQYAKFIGGHGVPITAVVTEMRFDTASATPKLTFRAVRPLTPEELVISKSQGESKDAQNAIIMTVSQTDGIDTPTQPLYANPEVKAEATEEAPVVKRASKKVETKDIAATLDDWADDEA